MNKTIKTVEGNNVKNQLEQIKEELNKLERKRQDIYKAIRVVDNLFSEKNNSCAICGLTSQNVDHRDEHKDHEYVQSIYVGNLKQNELVYSIENVSNLYITREGLRFDAEETEEGETDRFPSQWYDEVRLNIFNNLETIIENVLTALKRQSEQLKQYDEGINKIERIVQVLKENDQ